MSSDDKKRQSNKPQNTPSSFFSSPQSSYRPNSHTEAGSEPICNLQSTSGKREHKLEIGEVCAFHMDYEWHLSEAHAPNLTDDFEAHWLDSLQKSCQQTTA
jgi:hypothetical protein